MLPESAPIHSPVPVDSISPRSSTLIGEDAGARIALDLAGHTAPPSSVVAFDAQLDAAKPISIPANVRVLMIEGMGEAGPAGGCQGLVQHAAAL